MIKREPLSLEKLEARLDFVIPEAFAPGLIPRAKNSVLHLKKTRFV